jgi:PTS system galactitol-specific IIA component
MLFDKHAASFHRSLATSEEVITAGAELLSAVGAVKEDFADHVLAREQRFPTGILVGKMGFALPHTEAEHVNFSQIAFLSLNEPVPFRYMADTKVTVPVTLVFVIAMKEPHEQVKTLSDLMKLLQDEQTVNELKSCSTVQDLSNILAKRGIY